MTRRQLHITLAVIAFIAVVLAVAHNRANDPDARYEPASISKHRSTFERADRNATTTTTTTTTTTAPKPKPRPRIVQQGIPQTAQMTVSLGDWKLPEGCSPTGKKDRAHSLHCWGGLINAFPWDKGKAFAVMQCESQGDSGAVGPRDSRGLTPNGLFQIKRGTFDPVGNVRHAYEMWAADGGTFADDWACA